MLTSPSPVSSNTTVTSKITNKMIRLGKVDSRQRCQESCGNEMSWKDVGGSLLAALARTSVPARVVMDIIVS
jgi:hypothetical protein